ncbi:hypothetical protein HanRHA438_Chr12g0537191 [Helianthus annuus]|nr:hypothetical protein HanRHA438_Chr12g0537191 [Helianthus annuus]
MNSGGTGYTPAGETRSARREALTPHEAASFGRGFAARLLLLNYSIQLLPLQLGFGGSYSNLPS